MAIIKCKMCGGDLILEEGSTVAECEYCGSRQTVPSADNEKKLNLFARANRLRAGSEFDKAAGVYESIAADFPEEAEAYWGLILCKYGIEYVDDPATGKKIPTCHRTSFDSVMDDPNFELVMEYADPVARRVYREEAKQLEALRKGIIEVSGKEAPYDIFICYKETNGNGDRTLDSVLAQDVYDMLTENGYRVFFSRVTLEDKLGQEYEPYIFAALNSARIMLAFGTDYDYYNAVWVKNEWSRFLQLIARGEKKVLIPCYKNLDAYDIPKEFARLQAQDMGKVGAMQDLLRGIQKILPIKQNASTLQPSTQCMGLQFEPKMDSLLKRGYLCLESGEWEQAKEYFNQVLNNEADNAEAYLGIALSNSNICGTFAVSKIKTKGPLDIFLNDANYSRFMRFASQERSAEIREIVQQVQADIERKAKSISILQSKHLAVSQFLSMGTSHIAAKRIDGSVLSAGYNYYSQCETYDWSGIVSVAVGDRHTVGLKNDGTVIAVGDDRENQSNVGQWKDITAISASGNYTVGITKNGNVLFAGNPRSEIALQLNSQLTGVIAAAAGRKHLLMRKADSTISAIGENAYNQCEVAAWKEIVAVAAGERHSVGLRKDGTVAASGDNTFRQCDVGAWTDIVGISAGAFHTVGVKADGTVLATGSNDCEQCNVSNWANIVAISAGEKCTAGLTAEGTIIISAPDGFCIIDAEQCIGCGLCKRNCLRGAIFSTQYTPAGHKLPSVAIDTKKCINCSQCIRYCGYHAISKIVLDSAEKKWKLFRSFETVEEETKKEREKYNQLVIEKQLLEEFQRESAFLLPYRERTSDAVNMIAAGDYHLVCLNSKGKVKGIGKDNKHGQCNTDTWSDIVAVQAGDWRTIGLKENGTIVATPDVFLDDDISVLKQWNNLKSIAAGGHHILGLKHDGTVIACYPIPPKYYAGECDVSSWHDIVAISARGNVSAGLRKDGTVVAVGDNTYGACDVQEWTNIVEIAVGDFFTVGLRSNGTVVCTKIRQTKNHSDAIQPNLSQWKGIIRIAGASSIVGLKYDGTVIVAKTNSDGYDINQSETRTWRKIVEIATSSVGEEIYGVSESGSVFATHFGKMYDLRGMDHYRLFSSFETIKEERSSHKAQVALKQSLLKNITVLKQKKEKAKAEVNDLTGLFSGKKRKAIEADIAAYNAQLNDLTRQLSMIGDV